MLQSTVRTSFIFIRRGLQSAVRTPSYQRRGCKHCPNTLVSTPRLQALPEHPFINAEVASIARTPSYQRRRRSLISAQGLERSDNPGNSNLNIAWNPERVYCNQPFQG